LRPFRTRRHCVGGVSSGVRPHPSRVERPNRQEAGLIAIGSGRSSHQPTGRDGVIQVGGTPECTESQGW
jgi:hypothetical protein